MFNFFKSKKKESEETLLDKEIRENPYKLVCPICLGNCGQCGVTGIEPDLSGHWVYLKDLKKHESYLNGFSVAISQMLNSK